MNDKDHLMNRSIIVSASPFRAVIRRNNTVGMEAEEEDTYRKSDDEQEDEDEDGEDFEREINNQTSDNKNPIFKTGREGQRPPLLKDRNLFSGLIEEEPRTA